MLGIQIKYHIEALAHAEAASSAHADGSVRRLAEAIQSLVRAETWTDAADMLDDNLHASSPLARRVAQRLLTYYAKGSVKAARLVARDVQVARPIGGGHIPALFVIIDRVRADMLKEQERTDARNSRNAAWRKANPSVPYVRGNPEDGLGGQ